MRYAKYKKSGISWLPEVPEGWEVRRLKVLFSQRKERNDPVQTANILSLTAAQGVVPISEKIGAGGNKPKDDLAQYDLAYPGDLVLNCMNVVSGSVGVSNYFGAISPVYYALVAKSFVDVFYYNNIFQTTLFQRSLLPLGKGILMHESSTGKLNTVRLRISMNALGGVKLPFPPLSEQKGIAAYLDEKCGKVDALVAAKERQVKLLKELRERVIADAVMGKISPTQGAENAENETSRTSRTRMLAHPSGSASPNLPSEAELLRRISREKTKPSGVFWQPMMPAHWVVRKLKYVLSKLRRERYPDAELLVCTNKGKVIKRGESKMGLVSDDISIYQGVKQGDLLIHGMDTWHGAVAVSDDDGMCTPVVHVCDSRDDKRFIAYYLRNMARGRVFKLISNGVRQNTSDFRSWEKLAAIPIILPPLSEQKEIVEYIERKTAKIDELAQKLEDEVKKLKEFRERLVADVVTGQRKVV